MKQSFDFVGYKRIRAAGMVLLAFAAFAASGPRVEAADPATRSGTISSEVVLSEASHRVQLLDTGALALHRILTLIESARESIDMNYYALYFCEDSAKFLMTAIQKQAARARAEGRPFRARLLLDFYETRHLSAGGLGDMVEMLSAHGVELKFFNPSPYLGLPVVDRLTFNQRDHQKRIIVDGRQAVIGGRQFGDGYFGMNPWFNRLDKDIWVEGPVVAEVAKGFESQWNHYLSKSEFPRGGLTAPEQDYLKSLKGCLAPHEIPADVRRRLDEAAAHDAKDSPEVPADKVAVGFDFPGFTTKSRSFIGIFRATLLAAKRHLLMENQYFVPRGATKPVLKKLDERNVTVEIVTNSMASGDAHDIDFLTLENSVEFSKRTKIKILGFKGLTEDNHRGFWWPGSEKTKWQIHSKASVIDGAHAWIGSNNMDGRSDHINLETAVLVIDNPRFAEIVTRSIRLNSERAIELKEGPHLKGEYAGEHKHESLFDKLKRRLLVDFY